MFGNVAKQLKGRWQDVGLVISIVAGIPTSTILKSAGSEQPVIRCMPNIAASVGRSITVAVGNQTVTAEHRQLFEQIFSTSGTCHWLTKEEGLHAVTAVSGSGPAYFFAPVEAMAHAGSSAGLDPALAGGLALDTMIGAAALLERDCNATNLREQVTSPGGTTAAALGELRRDDALNVLTANAVKTAIRRSHELSQ